MTERRHDLFAVASPGLERVVAAELRGLGFADAREVAGGASFSGSHADALHANLWLRSASRILLRLALFDAPGRRELAARLKRLDLAPFVPAGAKVHVGAAAQQSRLYHTGLLTDVACEALNVELEAKDVPAPTVYLRLLKDRCTVSVDTSGELLHRRGYRLETARAPLRETLAAGLLLLAGYDGTQPLVDPMCGSGTIPIEAALLATGRAPNATRAMALERFPSVDPERLRAVRARAAEASRPARAPIHGFDIHAGALHAARANATRAQVESLITHERADVGRLNAPGSAGLLVTNPPYGKRVQRDRPNQADPLDALARALEGPFASWDRFVFGPGQELRRAVRLPVVRAAKLDNGGIPVEMIQFRRTTVGGPT